MQQQTQERLDQQARALEKQTAALSRQALQLRDGFRSVTMIPNLVEVATQLLLRPLDLRSFLLATGPRGGLLLGGRLFRPGLLPRPLRCR